MNHLVLGAREWKSLSQLLAWSASASASHGRLPRLLAHPTLRYLTLRYVTLPPYLSRLASPHSSRTSSTNPHHCARYQFIYTYAKIHMHDTHIYAHLLLTQLEHESAPWSCQGPIFCVHSGHTLNLCVSSMQHTCMCRVPILWYTHTSMSPRARTACNAHAYMHVSGAYLLVAPR